MYLPLLSVAFYLRDGLTKSALDHHLSILRIATDEKYERLRSKHMLFSAYKHLKTDITKIYVCKHKKCSRILTTTNGIPDEQQPCGHKHDKQLGGYCYVLLLPIEKQLIYFIEHHGLSSNKWNNIDPNIRSDVNSGDGYRNLRERGLIDEYTITVQLNTDGAQCFQVCL